LTEIAVYLAKKYEIGPRLLRTIDRKPQVAEKSVSVQMTLKGEGKLFHADLRYCTRTV